MQTSTEAEEDRRYCTILVEMDLYNGGQSSSSLGRRSTLKKSKKLGYKHVLSQERASTIFNRSIDPRSCDYFYVVDTLLGETVFSQVEILELAGA